MKKRLAMMILAAAVALSACGKVEEPGAAPDVLTPPTENPSDIALDEETTDRETTDEEHTAGIEQIYKYCDDMLVEGFGFEIYCDGHIADAWDYRYDAAFLMLEAMAQPGTEEGEVDFEYTLDQLNGFESKGFMAHIKFEDEKEFRVGSWTINGVCMMIAGDDGEYYSWIEYFNENGDYRCSSYFMFDESYIPRLLKAVRYGEVSEENTAEEPVPAEYPTEPEEDDSLRGYLDSFGDVPKTVDVYYNGEHDPAAVDKDMLVRQMLKALADRDVASNAYDSPIDEGWMEYSKENGFYVWVDFDGKTQVRLGDETIEVTFMTMFGCAGDFSIIWDDGNRVPIMPDLADYIINKSCGQ